MKMKSGIKIEDYWIFLITHLDQMERGGCAFNIGLKSIIDCMFVECSLIDGLSI